MTVESYTLNNMPLNIYIIIFFIFNILILLDVHSFINGCFTNLKYTSFVTHVIFHIIIYLPRSNRHLNKSINLHIKKYLLNVMIFIDLI